jgi:hypothetical protein
LRELDSPSSRREILSKSKFAVRDVLTGIRGRETGTCNRVNRSFT